MSYEKTLPSGWCLATIGDTGEYINGFPFKPSHRVEGGIPIIRIQNLTDEDKPISGTTLPVDDIFKVETGDLLVSWSATLDAFIWRRGTAYVNQHIFKVIPSGLIDKRLLFYWLKIAIGQLKDSEHLHGSTMKHINRGPFIAHEIPVPPQNEQVRILEKLEELLSDLDDGVAELKAAQAKLTQYRQSLLKSAVEGSLTAEWRAENEPTETGEQLLKSILAERRKRWEKQKLEEFEERGQKPPKDWQKKYPEPVAADTSELPELPEGWVWASVVSTGDVQLGRQRSPKYHAGENMVPYLRVANVFEDRIDTSDVMWMHFSQDDEKSYLLESGDVLLNEGQSLELVGRAAIYRGELNRCCFTNTLVRYKPSRNILSEYALLVFRHYLHSARFQKIAKITTNIAHLGAGRFSEIEFPIPPIVEQREIIRSYQSNAQMLNEQYKAVLSSIKQAESQRKNVLKDAFSGRLVDQDPGDEAASVLLERIKAERKAKEAQPTPRSNKKKAEPKVKKMIELEDILKKQSDWIEAQQLFRACGVGDNADTDRVEALYGELRELDQANRLDIKRSGDFDFIKLKAEAV